MLIPGVMLNQCHWNELSLNDVEFCVTYNDQTLMSGTGIDQPQTIELEFDDTKELIKHNLVISVANLSRQDHMIKVMIYVQDHCVNAIFLDQLCYYTNSGEIKNGSIYMGENGYQQFEICTPIYQWLFEHEKYVVNEISE